MNRNIFLKTHQALLSATGFALLIVLGSCNNSLEPVEFARWVEEPGNGLHVIKEIGDLEYQLQCRPLDYIVVKEEKKKQISRTRLESRKKELEGLQYYRLRFANKSRTGDVLASSTTSHQDYQDRLTYASFDMQEDIYLVEGQDTLPCRLYHFVRSHGVAPYVDFMLAFDQSPPQKTDNVREKVLVYQDRIFNHGILKFRIREKALIPKLNTI